VLPRAPRVLDEPGARAADDPTVRGTRLVPESLREARQWGVEAGGGVRATVSAVRLVSGADGSLVTAPALLPSTPSSVVAVPERMGGGFLYVLGAQLWRSETWLGDVRPLFRAAATLGEVLVGPDRAYVWFPPGTLAAFDPRTGAAEDLGPLPPSPRVGRLAALDAWRAVAIADLRGAIVTLDAGASWRPLQLPIDATDVVVVADAIVVHGLDAGRHPQWWEVGPDGQAARLASAPALPAAVGLDAAGAPATDPAARALGASPLAAAIEDGWPLSDGTALVARDGLLARVRLADGSVVRSVPDAFPLRPARCHAVSLSTPREPGAFGFVCGEPKGRTVLYRWDGARSGLAELRRFDDPREVVGSGNGALAARGSCSPASRDTPAGEQAWCVMSPSGAWTERVFRGEDVNRARVVVLSDGKVALVRPPVAELATGRLTLSVEGGIAAHVPLRFPLMHDDVAKALLRGIWMDGFEERRPGVLGGWVDASGAVVGIEIALDGAVRVGEFIRDAGAPVASGRWAFGWTASRRAFETTDGGMTWTKGIEVPDPVAQGGAVHERACGPVGCIAAGWLRVGWTAAGAGAAPAPAVPLMAAARALRQPPALRLRCDRLAVETLATPAAPAASARPGAAQPALVAPGVALPAFCGAPGPARPADVPGIVAEVAEGAGWPRRAAPVATIYAWGPASGDWDRLGRWQVRWRSPWAGCGSSSGVAPWPTIDAAARALGRGGGASSVALFPGDDANHALLSVRRPPGVALTALEAGRPPVEIRRADGDALPDLESAVRAGGRWYLASSQPASQLAATLVWRVEDGVARELARLPRAAVEGSRPGARLARSAGGRALGVVVEGRPDALRGPAFWVASVDPETGDTGDPEPLAPVDLAGLAVSACTGDDPGWEFDLPYAGAVELQLGAAQATPLQAPFVTMRLSRDRACVERVVGTFADEVPPGAPPAAGSGRPIGARPVEASVVSGRARTPLRCWFP
jgi:hypothetical protein